MSTTGTTPGWFDSFRMPPFPTLYGDLKTPVTADVLYAGWIAAFLTILVSFICILPALSFGILQRFLVFLRICLFLLLGLVIMLCNFGQEWEVGDLDTHTPYRAGTGQEIYANVGVKLGLRSVNITLKALEEPHGDLRGETIDYNERFSWTWTQGRAGFGPFAGEIQRSFRAAQWRGVPLPILWVAEYFTFDGEGIRFGRYYRTSGWFAHICVWTAFPLWLLTIVLSKLVITYAAMTLALTGTMLLIASIIWAANRNFIELAVPFTPPEGILRTHYGVHWYLALIVGIVCLVVGVLVYVLDGWFHDELSKFFGNNLHTIVEEETTVEQDDTAPSHEMEMEDMEKTGVQRRRQPRVVTVFRGRGTTKKYNKKVSYSSYPSNTPAHPGPPPFTAPSRPPPPEAHHQGPVVYPKNQGSTGYQHRQPAQGYPQAYPQGQTQDYQQAYPQGQAQGYPQDYPQGQAQGYPQDYPQGQAQGYPQGYQHGYPTQDYPEPDYQNLSDYRHNYLNQGYAQDYQAQAYQGQKYDSEDDYDDTRTLAKPAAPALPPKRKQ